MISTRNQARTTRLIVFFALAGLTLASVQAGNDIPRWSQFRGPNARGVAESEKPPVRFGPNTNLIWRTPVSAGASSPCIWDDRIFLTASGKGYLETLCLDRRSGRKLWSAQVTAQPTKRMHRNNSPASPTPATDGRLVYVYLSPIGLLAYDLDGVEQWRKPLPVPANPHGAGSSPVLIEGNLIVNCEEDGENSCLLAVNPTDGRTVWKIDRRGLTSTYATPILWQHEGKNDLMHASCLQLLALDPKTGRQRWFARGLEFISHVSTPVLGEGMVFVMSRSVGEDRDPDFATFLALYDRNKDGKIEEQEMPADYAGTFMVYDKNGDGFVTADEWEHDYKLGLKSDYGLMAVRPGETGDVTATHVVWKQKKGVPQVPSPLYYRGRLYAVENGGRVTSYEAKTGKILYQQERLGATGDYYASPVAANGAIYFSSDRGTVTVIAAAEPWRVLAQNPLEERLLATPAIVDNKIYVRTDEHVWAFGQQ